jgi:hypothetical protein
MKKKVIIALIVLAIGILTLIGYYNIHVKKQWEIPEKESSKTSQIKTDVAAPSKEEKKTINKKHIIQEATSVPFKRPERCQELMKKRSEATDFKGGLTPEEEDYLRDACRIPISRSPLDTIKVLKWWRDEDGYEDMMWVNIDELIGYAGLPGVELTGVIEPLKNIALNSKFPSLRERAVIALHKIDNKKSIPILKEVLRKEVKERGVTKENRTTIISLVGEILSEEGEYEFAFPYIMQAQVFYISAKRNDRRAIPYMYKTLQTPDPCIRVITAFALVSMQEKNDAIFKALLRSLEETRYLANSKKPGDPGCRLKAVQILGDLQDYRALPLLEELQKKEFSGPYVNKVIKEAIRKIKGGGK